MSLTGDKTSAGGGSKTIKCFCNDDLCGVPSKQSNTGGSATAIGASQSTSYPPHLAEFLIKHPSLKYRTCQTETACMTKRYKRPDSTYYYKYYCDHHSQPTGINSIRHQVIAYRDCRVDSLALPAEREHVLDASAEHCCSDQDFCNVLLKPTAFVRDPLEYTNDPSNKYNNNNNNNMDYPSPEDPVPTLNITNHQPSPNGNGSPTNSINGPTNSNVMGPGHVVLICFSGFLLAFVVILFGICLKRKSNKLRMFLKKPSKLIQPSSQQNVMNVGETVIGNGTVSTGGGGTVGVAGGGNSSVLLTSSSNSNSNTTTSASSSAPSPYSTSTTSTSLNSKENSLNNPQHGMLLHHQPQVQKLIEESFSSSAPHHHHQLKHHGLYSAELKSGANADLFEPLLGGGGSTMDTTGGSSSAARVYPNHTIALFKGNVTPGNIVIKSPLTHSNTIMSSSGMNPTLSLATTGISSLNTTTNNPNTNNDEWSGSGSGAGMPECMNRTIARQIKLTYPCIGKGRFGEVYKGEWRGENVAVKTFNSADEKSWENECNIYNTSGFRHENILGFIAADNIDRGLYTELWLITEYHANGSLHDYLTSNQITIQQGIQMLLSIATGLDHLHTPIESYKGKPALAHCDLKSKNILVKSNLTCCIGDLGLAIRGDRDGRVVLAPGTSLRMGTKRYLAPEILTKQLDQSSLIGFQRAEIYSLGLIMWEVLRACQFESQCHDNTVYSFEYKLPYYEYINNQTDPDEALMKQIVCDLEHRPVLLPQWNEHTIMKDLTQLCTESWDKNPNARNTALRIKKSLARIAQKNQEQS